MSQAKSDGLATMLQIFSQLAAIPVAEKKETPSVAKEAPVLPAESVQSVPDMFVTYSKEDIKMRVGFAVELASPISRTSAQKIEIVTSIVNLMSCRAEPFSRFSSLEETKALVNFLYPRWSPNNKERLSVMLFHGF